MLKELRSAVSNFIAPTAIKQTPVESGRGGFLTQILSPSASGGVPPRLGTEQLLRAYSEMPWLRALVHKVGRSVGTVQWKLLVVREEGNSRAIRPHKVQRATSDIRKQFIEVLGKQQLVEEIHDHPLLDLLTKGNMAHMGMGVMQVTQQHLDLVGEGFWLLEKARAGIPIAIWPLPPHWIKEFPKSTDPRFRVAMGSMDVMIPATEIISFIDPDPHNPYGRGSGIAGALGDELEINEYAAKHLKGFFYNRARPDLIVSAEGLTPQETQRMEERWLDKAQGFWRSFKPHFLNRKVDIKELGMTFEHMQMAELRKGERDTIIQVYGFPPEKFGIVNESKRSTIAAADTFWNRDILLPRLEMLRTVMQETLVPLYDARLVLDFESPVVQDEEHQLETMRRAPWAFTRGDWRKKGQHPPIGDPLVDDVFVMPANMFERPAEGEFVAPTPPGGGGGSDDPGLNPDQPADDERSRIKTLMRGMLIDKINDKYKIGLPKP